MAKIEDNYFVTNEKYRRGFKVEEYKGEISIVACNEGKEGQIFPEWVSPQGSDRKPKKKDDGSYVMLPLKIKLGDSPESALDTLRQIAAVLKGAK
ncbi:MAG TPA: hypothetical protein DCR95_11525 [Desulfobacter sp.]|nr:hypothetical protein [Desulfobacter sp.]